MGNTRLNWPGCLPIRLIKVVQGAGETVGSVKRAIANQPEQDGNKAE